MHILLDLFSFFPDIIMYAHRLDTGGVHDSMVIVVGNELSDTSSNPG